MPALPDAAAFALLAVELGASFESSTTAETVVRRLVDLLPDADDVSLTLRSSRGHRTVASTSETATRADALQYELREGPSLAVADGEPWLRVGDLRLGSRWPRWSREAHRLGFGSMVAAGLHDHEGPIGSLNVYSRRVGALSDPAVRDLVVVYAAHASQALAAALKVTNLTAALGSRHLIGMAQGVLMRQFDIDERASFDLLSRLASTHERKLRDIASEVVRTRVLVDEVPPADPAS